MLRRTILLAPEADDDGAGLPASSFVDLLNNEEKKEFRRPLCPSTVETLYNFDRFCSESEPLGKSTFMKGCFTATAVPFAKQCVL